MLFFKTSEESGRKKRRKKRSIESTQEVLKEPVVAVEKEKPESKKYNVSGQPVLMVEVENVTHEKFRQTEEVKVCSLPNFF